jgi:UDP-N-acetylglucosamine--N-acetylmuramyl-(pentapeptide) pyrophosphoryl-undecaprenol N-acetylglucosamine transferase
MSSSAAKPPFVAIACGGTGGHLFPGLAVAEQLQKHGCIVALLISPKDVDQQAVKSARGMEIFTLPAVALQNRNYFSFVVSFLKSLFAAQKIFRSHKPDAVLAMGGFTSAPPIWVGKDFGAKTFLHESNTIPGRANRFLSRFVDESFVGFSEAGSRLKGRKVTTTGTPVRPQFSTEQNPAGRDSAATGSAHCRTALGFDPARPVILVTGGSQGASGLNDMVLSALPLLAGKKWQWLHLTGANDVAKVNAAYAANGVEAIVKPFLAEMDLALGAATVAVSRSGASSLAEIAAMRLPSLLVPYPTAADNHQLVNALAFEKTGAARLLEQKDSLPEKISVLLRELVEAPATREKMQAALAHWHSPLAAEKIAEKILVAVAREQADIAARKIVCSCGHAHGSEKHAH